MFKCFALLLSALSSLLMNEFPDSSDNPSNKPMAYEQIKVKNKKNNVNVPHGVFERSDCFLILEMLTSIGWMEWMQGFSWEFIHKENMQTQHQGISPTSTKSVFIVFVS